MLHGGSAGLVPGDLILPASKTGALGHSSERAATSNYRSDRVYVTTGLDYAQMFAHMRDGAVYEVEPVGQVRVDSDSLVAPSWSCRRARVLRVVVAAPAPLPASVDPAYVPLVVAMKRRDAARG